MNKFEEIKFLEIREELVNNEINKRVGNYVINHNELERYYNVGKLLIEAQGGEERAKYGDGLIKKYSERLTKEIGKGYSTRNLKRMRKFYLFQKWQPVVTQCDNGEIQKGAPLVAQSLSWTHYIILLSLDDINEINYYIKQIEIYHWSKRELIKHIKSKEYQRLPVDTKNKLINKEENRI